MDKQKCYIRERNYHFKPEREGTSEKMNMWEGLLGKKAVQDLYRNLPDAAAYLGDRRADIPDWLPETDMISNSALPISEDAFQMIEVFLKQKKISYAHIYIPFLETGYDQLKNQIENTQSFHPAASCFLERLFIEMQFVSIRSLIAEMHENAEKNSVDSGRYEFFMKECLQRENYKKELFLKYPVLERCFWECVERNVRFFSEVLNRIENDKEEIEEKILNGEIFHRIEHIEGNLSDSHLSGQQVLQIKLDNGKVIIYKPHNIENEKWFGEFLLFLGNKCGINMHCPRMVIREEYGWVEYIGQSACGSFDELKNYYYRIGISLFAAYLLGTNDIHCENLIAMGEYPVIVDLESLIGSRRERAGKEMTSFIHLQESVLNSGILPYYHWSLDGKGVDFSAVAGGNGCEAPFRIPVIKNAGTDAICVDYEYAKILKAHNHAIFEGQFLTPDRFEKEISAGFRDAFRYTMNDRDVVKGWISKISRTKSRYLIEDTQKYAMLLNSSYHPQLMKDAADREFLFYALWSRRRFDSETDRKIVDGEIFDLLGNDIPYFYFYADETVLYDSRGNQILDYFEESPIESVYRRLDTINESDLRRQERLIHLSLSASGEEDLTKSIKFASLRDMIRKPALYSKKDLLGMAENIADKLLDEAEYEEGKKKINWLRLMVMGSDCGAIHIQSCGMYLYDGLGGISVFLHMLEKYSHREKDRKVCEILDSQIFLYTDMVYQDAREMQSVHSGLYNGEGSIVYTYLMLYWNNGNPLYMEYAKRHAEILFLAAMDDPGCDLLEGKAGAVLVLCYMYLSTDETKYLRQAGQIGEKLLSEGVEIKDTIGWKPSDGRIPLLGAAHGNAGILIALSKLYALTKEQKYLPYIERALRYEEGNFNARTGDWYDFRKENMKWDDKKEERAAWCYGAGGILLSRIILAKEQMPQIDKDPIYHEIEKALKYVKAHSLRKELCLCHGESGNMRILQTYQEWKNRNNVFDKEAEKDGSVLTKEWYHPGLMSGYTGIGYYLVLQAAEIPDYLFLSF